MSAHVVLRVPGLESSEPFEIRDVAAVTVTRSAAMLDFASGEGGIATVPSPVYPDSPRGRAFRAMRLACGLNLVQARDLLKLRSVVEVSGLEVGSKTFAYAADWLRAEGRMHAAAPSLEGIVESVEVITGPRGPVESFLGRQGLRVGPCEDVSSIATPSPRTSSATPRGVAVVYCDSRDPTKEPRAVGRIFFLPDELAEARLRRSVR